MGCGWYIRIYVFYIRVKNERGVNIDVIKYSMIKLLKTKEG